MTSVGTAYPPPDEDVRSYFTNQESGITNRMCQAARYGVFFGALFDMALSTLCPHVESPRDLRQQLKIGPERRCFYETVVRTARSIREGERGLEVRIICNTRTPVN